MGAIRCIFDESQRTFVQAGSYFPLNLEGTRRFQSTPLRYCMQGDVLYLPKDINIDSITFTRRFCWARIRYDVIQDLDFSFHFNQPLPEGMTIEFLETAGVGFGSRYLRRHRETENRRTPVAEFCSATLINGIQKNPEALQDLSRAEFQELCAELFVSRGFEVDLYRLSKDGGVDFLALKTDGTDPMIFVVQCKHPDAVRKNGKGPRPLPPATIREIYGVAKASNLTGGIAITSAEYSSEAKKFAELKPMEMEVHNRTDVLKWIEAYRWNSDET